MKEIKSKDFRRRMAKTEYVANPRNFNYKIVIKIQASNGKNSKNRPLDKLEEYAVLRFENTTFLVG